MAAEPGACGAPERCRDGTVRFPTLRAAHAAAPTPARRKHPRGAAACGGCEDLVNVDIATRAVSQLSWCPYISASASSWAAVERNTSIRSLSSVELGASPKGWLLGAPIVSVTLQEGQPSAVTYTLSRACLLSKH